LATPEALDLLEQFGTTVRMARDGEIYAEGDNAQFCYRVVTGCARTVKLLEDGRRQVGEFFLPGDLLGLDDLDSHDYAAEAVTELTLRRYPRRMVEALAESHASLSHRLRELALHTLRTAHGRMVMLGRKTATERIAAFLLEMDNRISKRGTSLLDLPMNRSDMADHLGLTVETICRVLAQLKRQGVVGIQRAGVELRNRDALQDLTCEAGQFTP
jgi:CRP-like cAMP-binding protein